MTNETHSFICYSNGQTDLFPENTLTSFTNLAPELFYPKSEDFEIAINSFGIDLNLASFINDQEIAAAAFFGLPEVRPSKKKIKNNKKIHKTWRYTYDKIPKNYKIFLPNSRWVLKEVITYIRNQFRNSPLKDFLFHYYPEIKEVSLLNTSPKKKAIFIQKQLIDLFRWDYYVKVNRTSLHNFYNVEYYCFWLASGEYVQGKNFFSKLPVNTSKILNVHCNLVKDYNSSNKICQSLASHHIPQNKSDSYLVQTFKNPVYYDLKKQDLNKISIKFLNEENNQIRLLRGTASFVNLVIRKKLKMENTENFRISSKVTVTENTNTPSEFTGRLRTPIDVPVNSSICLASAIIPNQIITLPNDFTSEKILIKIDHTWKNNDNEEIILTSKNYAVELVPGYYKNNLDLVSMINKQVLNELKIFFSLEFKRYLKLNIPEIQVMKKFWFWLFKNDSLEKFENIEMVELEKIQYEIKIPISFSRLFGFTSLLEENSELAEEDYIILNTDKDVLFRDPMFIKDFFPNYLMIYCDKVKPVFVGGDFSPLLHILPINSSDEEYQTYQVKNLDYKTLDTTNIDCFKIKICSHDGRLIEFMTNSEVILNFKIKLGE